VIPLRPSTLCIRYRGPRQHPNRMEPQRPLHSPCRPRTLHMGDDASRLRWHGRNGLPPFTQEHARTHCRLKNPSYEYRDGLRAVFLLLKFDHIALQASQLRPLEGLAMLIVLPLVVLAASSFALGYSVRALKSAQRRERSHAGR
jgi:hypothetical protein